MKRTLALFLLVVCVTLMSSWAVSSLWGTPPEAPPEPILTLEQGMRTTLESGSGVRKTSSGEAALEAEQAGKNWKKILPKLGLWAVFLAVIYRLVTRGRFTAKNRKQWLLAAVAVFGVALGSDPSPMGTVKDAVVLLATHGVVFPPRLIAMVGFLATVVLANKAICAWGCQLGTLQDLLFRINRNDRDTAAHTRQWKIPFVISNSIRAMVFAVFAVVAFTMGFDLIGAIDPFKTFNPAHLGLAGGILLACLLVAALFIYRPWCHLACPFGLVGWMFERLSLNRIRVNVHTCTGCGACARACPSDAMEAILKQQKILPDCFSCGTCMEVCPTRSITFGRKPVP